MRNNSSICACSAGPEGVYRPSEHANIIFFHLESVSCRFVHAQRAITPPERRRKVTPVNIHTLLFSLGWVFHFAVPGLLLTRRRSRR